MEDILEETKLEAQRITKELGCSSIEEAIAKLQEKA